MLVDAGVAHVLALYQEDHVATDVLGVTADTLQRPQPEDHVHHVAHAAGILHDEGGQTPQGRAELLFQLLVASNHLERQVEILGRDSDTLVVRAFDTADGVVAVPPPEVRAGLLVEPVNSTEFASTGGVAGAAK